MNFLSTRERELVALGAAVGSNCAPCIDYHVPEARTAGLTDRQIQEAVELADAVRAVSARDAMKAAERALGTQAADAPSGTSESPCKQLGAQACRCC